MIRNKAEDRSTSISQPSQSSPSVPEPTFSAPVANINQTSVKPAAVIGPKIRFKGELVGEEDLLIQGQVDGTIDLKGNTLVIGEQGVVRANVLAQTITIEGTVEGDVYGEERISIKSSSNVKGNLVADRVTLEDGAKFKGSIDMEIDSRRSEFENFNQDSSLSLKPAKVSAPASIASKEA